MDEKVYCKICTHQFSKFSNLRKHVKKFHSDKLDDVAPYKKRKEHYNCKECGNFFLKCSYLKIHVKKYHADKYDQLFPKKSYNYKCDQCGNQFSHKFHYNSHLKRHLPTMSDPKIKCPMCSYRNSKSEEMIKHYENVHDIQFQEENLKFETMKDLQKWKTDTEKQEKSLFVLLYHNKNKTNEKIKYICHRSGNYNSRGQNIRHLKTQGSNKINGFCPASISITVENNTYFVQFQRNHVGHDADLGHLQLTKVEREAIASKIAAKIPFQSILDEIKDSLVNSNIDRIHLLTKKDLFNIERTYNLNGTRHKNDLLSVYLGDIEARNSKIIETLSRHKSEENLDKKKEQLKSSILEVIDNIESVDQFEAIEKILATAKPSLIGIKNNAGKTNALHSKNNVPHNKKIV